MGLIPLVIRISLDSETADYCKPDEEVAHQDDLDKDDANQDELGKETANKGLIAQNSDNQTCIKILNNRTKCRVLILNGPIQPRFTISIVSTIKRSPKPQYGHLQCKKFLIFIPQLCHCRGQ